MKILEDLELNFGTKWFDFNFTSLYNKMENFTDPNEMPKEMEFYTFEEFKTFISVEDDLKFKELILKCLNINIEKRISIKELKDDSWFSL